MNIKYLILIGLTTLATSGSCSLQTSTVKESKNYVTKEMKIAPYTRIKLTGSPDVVFTQAPGEPSLKIYTSDNIVDLLDIHVDNQTLHIGFKKGVSVNYSKLIINATSPNLNQVSVTGSGEVTLANELNTEDLYLQVTGSGDIDAGSVNSSQCTAMISGSGDITIEQLSAKTVQAKITGSGDIVLKGRTQKAQYEVMGSGDVAATELQAQEVSARITGSGDIRCNASNELEAHVTGSGDIGYKGNPTVRQQRKGVYKID